MGRLTSSFECFVGPPISSRSNGRSAAVGDPLVGLLPKGKLSSVVLPLSLLALFTAGLLVWVAGGVYRLLPSKRKAV